MSLFGHEDSGERHLKAKLAAGVGALGAAGATYVVWRKHRNRVRLSEADDQAKTSVFRDETIDSEERQQLAEVAARIFVSTFWTENCAASYEQLEAQLDINSRQLKHSLDELKERGLIGQRPGLIDGKKDAFFAEDILADEVDYGSTSDLQQFVGKFLADNM